MSRADQMPAVRMDDAPSLLIALLDLAQDGRLDLTEVDTDDLRQLHDALGQVLRDRSL